MPSVHFFEEDVSFFLDNPQKTSDWIKMVILSEGKQLDTLNFIFCSDEYLLKLNQKYLNHNTYTDIITFDNSDRPDVLYGDVFISIERVIENSKKLTVSQDEELHRVIVHGVLHLLGFSDKTTLQRNQMRKKENAYLSLRTV